MSNFGESNFFAPKGSQPTTDSPLATTTNIETAWARPLINGLIAGAKQAPKYIGKFKDFIKGKPKPKAPPRPVNQNRPLSERPVNQNRTKVARTIDKFVTHPLARPVTEELAVQLAQYAERQKAEREKTKAKIGSIDIWGGIPGGVESGWGSTGGSGGGKPSSMAEAEYNSAQGGTSDSSTGSQSFSGSAADGWGATGGSGGGAAESQAEANFNAGQGGPSDSSTGSASFSGAPGDFGMDGLGSDTEGAGGWGFPIVLDLDGDGRIDVIPPSQSQARFDVTGTGRRQLLAWVSPDDGVPVYDEDGDRLISHWDEIAFKDFLATAKTDLEGLAWFDQIAQGGNEDGVLDERDEAWSKFGVWQDVDQDGQTDPGELHMSKDGGLTSVNLMSDEQAIDVGPDAKVFGRGSYEYQDHNGATQSADLFDTALRYEDPSAKSINSDATTSKELRGLPPLVRLDGQPLKLSEKLYPAMAYKENVYEAWPEEAITKATKRYPELPRQIEESRQLVPDHPDDLLDPDYFEEPENPTLKDLYRASVWKQKKQGKL